MLLYCITTLFVYCSLAAGERPIVKTSLGSIEGQYKESYNGRLYSAFEGIPYAKPPIRDLRFKEPISAEPWIGIWNATTLYKCLQNNLFFREISGEEDCLYLNVYVPRKVPTPTDNFDVVVHIHGGAFMIGSPSMLSGPKLLMDKDIIYVNLNYRLGSLGFLSTEDQVVTGNNGLKDQVLALKWIQEHIKQFGGNPNSVTLTGVSAGAAAVHFHYFSKQSKNLFHRGLSQSGTALAPWAMQEGALRKAKKLAALLGCDDESSQVFIKCMKQRSARQIVEYATDNLYSHIPRFPVVVFGPVVEKDNSENAFLIDHPYNLLKNKDFNDKPWITSMATEEGILGILLLHNKFEEIDEQWNGGAQYFLEFNDTVCEFDKVEVAKKIKKYYFGEQKMSQETVHKMIKLFGDRQFGGNLEKAARLQAANSKHSVYSYIYSYLNSFMPGLYKAQGIEEEYGVGHADDGLLMYEVHFMGTNTDEIAFSKEDIDIKNLLIDMVASFARDGIPKMGKFNWNPVTNAEEFSYLSVPHPDKIEMTSVKELTPKSFWDSLPIMENEKVGLNLCEKGRDNRYEKNEL